MSYRLEKEENGGTAIVIDGWEKGTAPDPYSGINRMLQVDLTVPGEVSVGYPITTSTTSGATLSAPVARSTRFFSYTSPGVPTGSPQSFAILDDNGHVFESTSITGTWNYLASNSSLPSSGGAISDGIAHWLGYLFKTRGANIDYWNGTTWSNGWYTGLTAAIKHYMYVGSDNVLYITNGNFLASVSLTDPSQPDSFLPGTPATYTITPDKLQLPATDVAISLAEVGGGNTPNSTLLIGGIQNAIYPWDKTSTNFALPIYVGDSYIKNIVSVNQNAFIFPGNTQGRGRIYITNGSQADEWFKIPDYLFNFQDPYYVWGDAIFHRNSLLFGFGVNSNANVALTSLGEVWALDLTTKAFTSVSDLPPGTGNASALLSTWNLTSPGYGYIAGWFTSVPAYGIGYSGTTAGIGTASITTDLVPVGTFLQKRTFTQVEYKLRTTLASGESISIIPVIDGVTGTALTFSPSATSGAISGVAPINFQGAQWLQFNVALTGNNTNSGCRLREIRLR